MNPRLRRLRRYFLVGLVVTAPVGLTVFVLIWVFNGLDSILGTPLQNLLQLRVPGLGFLLLAAFVLVTGWIVHHAVGRQLLVWWNRALVRFPLTGRIYNAVSQIVQGVAAQDHRVFRRAVLVPYPSEGIWRVGLVTSEGPDVLASAVGEPCLNVFLPGTPNAASGFVVVVPRNRVRDVAISVEDAIKLAISAGAVTPAGDRLARAGRQGLDLETLLPDERA